MSTPAPNPAFAPATPAVPAPPAVPAAPAAQRIALVSQLKPAATSSFLRLLRVEARKLADTLTGKVLLAVGAAVTLIAIAFNVGVSAWIQKQPDISTPPEFGPTSILTGSSSLLAMFVVLLGILSITGEWSQRTTLTTFALEPRRGRVLLAKVLVMMLVTTAIVALAIPLAYAGIGIADALGATVSWRLDWGITLGVWFTTMLGMLMGLGFGLLTLSSPAAMVMYFLLPMLLGTLTALGGLWEPLSKVMPWLDPSAAASHLVSPDLIGPMTATGWWQLLVANLVWVVVPFALGTWRWLRREVK